MPEPQPIIRNVSARLILISGERVTLRETLLGEQIRLSGGSFAREVTPMQHGRFRVFQMKEGVRAPIDLTAQHVEKIRRESSAGLGPMPKRLVESFHVTQLGLPFSGRIESFHGRVAVHGTCEKTRQERAIPLSAIQSLEVTRRRPPPRPEVIESETEAGHPGLESSEKENTVTVKPTEDRVLVKPIEAETKTAAGIYLPETAKEKPVKGEVIATGPGKRLDNGKRGEMSVRKGDTVVYGKYAGTEVEIKGQKHLIIRESELLGVIEG